VRLDNKASGKAVKAAFLRKVALVFLSKSVVPEAALASA